MAQIYKNETIEKIDCQTGKVVTIETSKSWTHKIKSEQFYMVFLSYLSVQFNLKSDLARKILIWMCEHAEYNTGIVELSAASRNELCSLLDIKQPSLLSRLLRTLKEHNLISGQKGRFLINPQIFWKGELATQNKLLEDKDLMITFSLVDKTNDTP